MQAEHSKNFPSDPWGHSGTTSYTGIAEVEPGVVLLAYGACLGIEAWIVFQDTFISTSKNQYLCDHRPLEFNKYVSTVLVRMFPCLATVPLGHLLILTPRP